MIWGIFSKRGKPSNVHLSQQENEWLESEGLLPRSVRYSVYTSAHEVSVPGAKVVVGVGKDRNGTAHGFVYERRLDGSIDGRILASPAVAMMDKQASLLSKSVGVPMMDTLVSRSLEWVAQGKPITY